MCVHCGTKGHLIDQCAIKMRGDKARANLALYEEPIDPTQFASYTVMTAPNVFSVTNSKVSLILDSGASANIVPDRASFESYTTDIPLSSSFIYTADNKPHEIKGQGQLAFPPRHRIYTCEDTSPTCAKPRPTSDQPWKHQREAWRRIQFE